MPPVILLLLFLALGVISLGVAERCEGMWRKVLGGFGRTMVGAAAVSVAILMAMEMLK